jgi:hypothetical protein
MKQNFAGQPDGGGALGYAGPLPTLTGLDLMSDVSKPKSAIFRPDPRFVNNCKNSNSMKNASGNRNFDYSSYESYDSYDNQNYNDTGDVVSAPVKQAANKKGGSWSWGDWSLSDLFNTAGQLYTTTQQNAALKEQGNLALQIEQQKKEREKAIAAQKAADSGSVASKIKAYTTPIIIVGVLTIGGIAAYFYFKKKKIS